MDSPYSADKVYKTIPKTNNPCQVEGAPDRAEYYVTTTGEIAKLRFPALLDRKNPGARIGKYFDLYSETAVSIKWLFIHVIDLPYFSDR